MLLYAGLALLLVGLLFKGGIAPFHNWTPDVYDGAPTPVTAFMAACTKTAAFAAILRVLYVGFSSSASTWRPVIYAVAIASMLVGAVFGLTQVELKRILAYSSIAHAGFILVALVAVTKDLGGRGAVLPGHLRLHHDRRLRPAHARAGRQRRGHPSVPVVRAGPQVAVAGHHHDPAAHVDGRDPVDGRIHRQVLHLHRRVPHAPALVIIALLASAVAAFFYLRIVVMMFFAEPPENGPTVSVPGWSTSVALTVCVLVTLVLGLFPQPLIDLAHKAATLVG